MSINPEPLVTESRPFAASTASLDPRPPTETAAGANGGDTAFWGEDGLDFGDLLDLINPLKQPPIISTLYREITGGTIAPGPRLFGGPLGMASTMVNLEIEDTTGRDIGANALALFDRKGAHSRWWPSPRCGWHPSRRWYWPRPRCRARRTARRLAPKVGHSVCPRSRPSIAHPGSHRPRSPSSWRATSAAC